MTEPSNGYTEVNSKTVTKPSNSYTEADLKAIKELCSR